MSRTVLCKKYQQELEGLANPPFPGPTGQEIFEQISKKAWQEWLSHQTMLINENRLNLMEAETKVFLDEQREKFLSNEDYEKPEGYTPQEKP